MLMNPRDSVTDPETASKIGGVPMGTETEAATGSRDL
jgi:hypothetical protein